MIKNITLSVDDSLIQKAREKARREHKSLNVVFRRWMAQYAGYEGSAQNYRRLMKQLSKTVSAGKKFSRDEMNER